MPEYTPSGISHAEAFVITHAAGRTSSPPPRFIPGTELLITFALITIVAGIATRHAVRTRPYQSFLPDVPAKQP